MTLVAALDLANEALGLPVPPATAYLRHFDGAAVAACSRELAAAAAPAQEDEGHESGLGCRDGEPVVQLIGMEPAWAARFAMVCAVASM